MRLLALAMLIGLSAQGEPLSLSWQVTVNLDGTGQRQLTRDAFDHDSPMWSPDGRKIVFSSNKSGGESIYLIDGDGTNEERLTTDSKRYIHPAWSPGRNKGHTYCSTDDLRDE